MIIKSKKIKDLIFVNNKAFNDKRGYFKELLKEKDLKKKFPFLVMSFSKKSVIRGLHLQTKNSQGKFITVIKGKIFDVAVDLRKKSDTYGCFYSTEICADIGNALLIPEGFAHGFQVLSPNSEILYIHSNNWVKESENGIRFDDPNIAINWPLEPKGISNRDLSLPFFNK